MHLTVNKITLPRLAEAFAGYRIAQISDTHFRDRDGRMVDRVVRLLADQRADLIAMTGDLLHKARFLAAALPAIQRLLRRLQAPDGLVGILGNHDCRQLVQATGDLPVRWLNNASLQIRRGGAVLNVAGVEHIHYNSADLPLALKDVDPAGPIILLAHFPSVLLHACYARIDLVLAGHTHGGQIRLSRRLPYFTNDALGWRFADGLVRFNGTQMYVTRGLGRSGPIPIRFLAPAELPILELWPQR